MPEPGGRRVFLTAACESNGWNGRMSDSSLFLNRNFRWRLPGPPSLRKRAGAV
jgi:hypothetical protein